MKHTKLLAILMALALLCTLLPGAALAAETAAGEIVTEVADYEAFAAALKKGGTVRLTDDFTGLGREEVPAGVAVTLDLNGHKLGCVAVESDEADMILRCPVVVYGSLTVTDSTADPATGVGEGVLGADEAMGGVYVREGGSVTVESGVVYGNAIALFARQEGSITINGGAVTTGENDFEDYNSTTVGVKAFQGSSVTINGGVIENCDFCVSVWGSSLEMTGGVVRGAAWNGVEADTDATAVISGGVITGCGYGVASFGGDVEITGGTITDSVVNGVDINRAVDIDRIGTLKVSGGVIEHCGCHGVELRQGSQMTFTGGEIAENDYTGLFIDEGCSAVMTGGALRDNGENGVWVGPEAGFTLSGGAISGSLGYTDEEDAYWGGAAVWAAGGILEMTGGKLSACLYGANATSGGTVTVLGGEIADLVRIDRQDVSGSQGVAAWNGGSITVRGGVFRNYYQGVVAFDCDFTLSGAPAFSGSERCDVWVQEGTAANIDAALTVEKPIRIEVEKEPAEGGSVRMTAGLAGKGTAACFTSAVPGYHVGTDASGEAVLLYGLPEVQYTDIPATAWYASDARFAAENGIFAEEGDLAFDADRPMTRGEAIYALWTVAGRPGNRVDAVVPWAEENGILLGDGAGNALDEAITREQMFTLIYRYLSTEGLGFTGLWSYALPFADAGAVSDWAVEAVSWLVMNDIVRGMDGGVNPGGPVTKAQVAALMQRVAELVK